MVRKLAVLTAALALCAAGGLADATKPGKTTVEGTMLTVSRQLDQKQFPGRTASTGLTVQVNCPGKQILSVDPSSKVSSLQDDKGTDLTKAPVKAKVGGFPVYSFGPTFMQSGIAQDRTGLLVSVYGSNAPAKGASTVRLKGELVLVCGTDEKTTDVKEVEIKMNAETKVGDFTFKVTQEKGFIAGSGGSFTITSTAPNIKTVNVKDAAGKTVDLLPGFTSGFGKNWAANFSMKRAVDRAKVSITYFSKQEKVPVPVDVSMGLGL